MANEIKICENELFLYFYQKIMRIKLFTYFISLFAVFLWHDVAYSQSKSQDVLNYIEQYKDIAMREMPESYTPASHAWQYPYTARYNLKRLEICSENKPHLAIKKQQTSI